MRYSICSWHTAAVRFLLRLRMRLSFVFACCCCLPQFVGVFVLLLHDVNRKSLQLFCFCCCCCRSWWPEDGNVWHWKDEMSVVSVYSSFILFSFSYCYFCFCLGYFTLIVELKSLTHLQLQLLLNFIFSLSLFSLLFFSVSSPWADE